MRLLLVLMLWAGSVAAQDFPDAFTVTGVAADDVLNIRSDATAASPIIGSFGPQDLNIEVLEVSTDGKWGRVGTGEGNGWVAMRFLARSGHNAADGMPRPFVCSGTEPFWTLALLPGGDEYLTPEGRRDLTLTTEATAPQGYLAIFDEGPTLTRNLIVMRGACSDGMSDRSFGWQAMLFNQAPDGNTVQTGCCTLDAH
ncbi:hypothetical protein ACOI1H_01070 [Loktanella sp. DJP18]|uniref:hypothetical protein n=1 Tax=Loktanella sp. DJP18 TaxID=3409788 RepID=UPI003BB74DC7